VLAGALAAGNRERVHDAVVLKTLGATRPTLIRMLIMEYALLGLATAVFAILAGSLAAWFVISVIMTFQFVLLPGVAAGTILAALGFTIILGLVGTWRILGQKAAPILREL
jgi:putative ABC transport system permease protein